MRGDGGGWLGVTTCHVSPPSYLEFSPTLGFSPTCAFACVLHVCSACAHTRILHHLSIVFLNTTRRTHHLLAEQHEYYVFPTHVCHVHHGHHGCVVLGYASCTHSTMCLLSCYHHYPCPSCTTMFHHHCMCVCHALLCFTTSMHHHPSPPSCTLLT